MPLKTADIRIEYAKNKKLREEDIKCLQEWNEKQPHLPRLTELQLILFLQSCYFSIEAAKNAIDSFFTVRTHCPELFTDRNPSSKAMKDMMDVVLYEPLPKPTKDNYRVMFCRTMDSDTSKYNFNDQFKGFDMCLMPWLMEEGTAEGLILITDMKLAHLGHMAKLNVTTIKKFLYYLQEALPVRLLGLHFINVVPFMDKLMAIMKPFMKKELMDVECLPKDYGGTADSIADLHASMKKRIIEHADYFKEEEKLVVDESKRPGKPKNAGDIFGVEGTFKKLDID